MGDIMVFPRHGNLQKVMRKDQMWMWKAVADYRANQAANLKEDVTASAVVVKAITKPSKLGSAEPPRVTGPHVGNADLLKSGNGCLLPTNTPLGPSVYYTGRGRYRR
ncbi:unnamed protein product [Polarella glacialis]|uniref:Uncharacterized protein n=1 Tax=Polarella glacialis TaxID=89957 RepID=A0A813E6E2_POLGL|nr:unnamed protein product [Polarella glacialis]